MLLLAQNSHGTRPAGFAANKRKLINLTFHKLGPYAHPSIALLCCCVRHPCSLLRHTGALFSNTRRLNNYNVPIIHNGILDFHSHFPPAHVPFVVNNRVAKLARNRKSELRLPVWFTLKGMLRPWHEQWHQQKANERWNYCVQVAVAGFIREKKESNVSYIHYELNLSNSGIRREWSGKKIKLTGLSELTVELLTMVSYFTLWTHLKVSWKRSIE